MKDCNVVLFQDPAVQQAAAGNGGQTAAAGLDNYDPFNKQKTTTTAAPAAGEQPAVMSPTQENPPPAYNQSAQQTVSAADFQVTTLGWTLIC